jgi:hypothetical protein
VTCRSQDNPKRTVPDRVMPGVVNIVFGDASVQGGLTDPPRRLDRPVLEVSMSGFPTTVRSSALVCSTRKNVNKPINHSCFANFEIILNLFF